MPRQFTTLVIGANGATGRFVVRKLLDRNLPVCVIVRSRDRMLQALLLDQQDNNNKATTTTTTAAATTNPNHGKNLLTIHQGSVLDLSDSELQAIVQTVDAIVSCLGHALSCRGIWGPPRRLVTDSVTRLARACRRPGTKLLVMMSDGVSIPHVDDQRPMTERITLWLLRHLLPPHADNEAAAEFLQQQNNPIQEWVGIRPTNLVDHDDDSKITDYMLLNKPCGLFGNATVSRINVAKFMVDLLTDEMLFTIYKGKFPVIHNVVTTSPLIGVTEPPSQHTTNKNKKTS